MNTLLLLHGQLGSPEDFFFLENLKTSNSLRLVPLDLMDFQGVSLIDFPEALKKKLQELKVEEQFSLCAYSMGGRLALHYICRYPETLRQAFILSAHPGLENLSDKKQRLSRDEEWAEKILKLEKDAFLKKWNEQAVFGDHKLQFSTDQYLMRREFYAWAFSHWSLVRQDNLRNPLLKTDLPVHFLAGQRDEKFVSILKEMPRIINKFSFEVVLGAGHRLLSEGSEDVTTWLEKKMEI